MLKKIKLNRNVFLLSNILLSIISTAAYSVPQPSFLKATQITLEPIILLMVILQKICLILGGIFIAGSMIQYLQYRKNDNQVPISRPILLGVLGLTAMLLPLITTNIALIRLKF